MTEEITMYPTSVKQPNRNESSGLDKKCFTAVKRNGGTYKISCTDQKDPKYYHEWSDAEEILKGKTIQCGRPSTKMCSHKTYYGIKGYRNTCPIAGVTGTYTQPATLRLFFDLSKKKISSSAQIKKVKISFEHRCTGVDVSNGKESVNWGPNFNGFDVYSSRKPLKLKLGSETIEYDKNPPLSKEFSGTGNFVFKDVTYKDLTKKGLDIIYGNNLETNPGNIYIRNLKATIYYTDEEPYIEGKQNGKSLYISDVDSCKTTFTIEVEAGYKQGNKKVPIKDAPSNLRNSISVSAPDNVSVSGVNDPKNDRKKIYTIKDNTLKTGKKTIKFSVKGAKTISFTYEAKRRQRPSISMISQIEKNTKSTETSIIAKNGCANTIMAYEGKLNSSNSFKFQNLDINNKENIIPNNYVNSFYEWLSALPCGDHTIFFRRDNEPVDEVISKNIKVLPTQYKFKVFNSQNEEITNYQTYQNKQQNEELKVVYVKTKELIENPNLIIENGTHGEVDEETSIPTKSLISNKDWTPDLEDDDLETTFTVGTYYPGKYIIKIKDIDETCSGNSYTFPIEIIPSHKQYYDEIFVRGEDSTAFDYDYLVALEGDSITKPVYVNTFSLGASYKDIKICTSKENYSGLAETNYFELKIKNISNNNIENLLLELNALTKDEDDIFHVSANEWLESDGIFYNFKENFDLLNKRYEELVSIKNLTPDEDYIDEENVNIYIKKLISNEEIILKIPFSCGIEKEVYLQVLLFEQPLSLYSIEDCSDETKTFDKILVRVYDSVLTEMDIIGETDLFDTNLVPACPNECFLTNLKYSIKNIDSSNLDMLSETIIENDPRLIPYKIEYGDREYKISNQFDFIFKLSDIYMEIYEEENTYKFKSYWDINKTELYGEGTVQINNTPEDGFIPIKILTDTKESFLNKELYIQTNSIIQNTLYPLYKKEIKNNYVFDEFNPQNLYIKINRDAESQIYNFNIYDDLEQTNEKGKGIVSVQEAENEYTPIKIISDEKSSFTGKTFYANAQSINENTLYQLYEKQDIEFNVITYKNEEAYRSFCLNGMRLDAYIQFDGYPEIHLHEYTDYQGEVLFYITIPHAFGESITTNELLRHMSIEFNGNGYYSTKKYRTSDTLYVDDNSRNIIENQINGFVEIEPFSNEIEYLAGQTIPLRVKLYGYHKYLKNEFIFKPKITNSGQSDSVTIYYQICNLDKNKGKLTTTFKTNSYKYIKNEVSKRIYCGVDTNLELYTKLSKIIVQNQSLNRLYLTLNNQERNNKDITVIIEEEMPIEKYDMINYELEKGNLFIENNKIIWTIDYIEENSKVNGYIDFKAKEIGYSKIKTSVTDFIDKKDPAPQFGEDSYKCCCRKVNKDDC